MGVVCFPDPCSCPFEILVHQDIPTCAPRVLVVHNFDQFSTSQFDGPRKSCLPGKQLQKFEALND